MAQSYGTEPCVKIDEAMRVLHLTHQYPPDHMGGTEHYTQLTARHLAAMGHCVGVVTRVSRAGAVVEAEGVEQTAEDGVAVYRVWKGSPTAQARYLATFARGALLTLLQQAITDFKPDLVHIQHLMGLPAAILAGLAEQQIPYVITLHDYWWVCANAQLLTNYSGKVCDGPQGYLNCTHCAVARGGNGAWVAAPALWATLAWRGNQLSKGLQAAHALIASTPFVAQWYQHHGAPDEKLHLLPLGIDLPSSFARTRSPGQRLQVAYLGGLAWQKGVHVVVEACRGLEDEVEFWVAGSADAITESDRSTSSIPYDEELRLHAGPHIHFLGKIRREEVWELLARVDVVVVPALWYETYSYLLHEALAAGIPVVASRLGVMAEAIQDGINGLLVTPGDVHAWRATLRHLAMDRDDLARLAATSDNRSNGGAGLTVAEHMKHLVTIYQEVLQSTQPALPAIAP